MGDPTASLVLAPIETLDGTQLARVRTIYEEAFIPDLRVPFAELAAVTEADRTYVALDAAAVVGFASLRLLGSVSWSFLRYFAIARDRRSQGAGRQFWHLLHPALARGSWPARIVFEVEDPDEVAVDEVAVDEAERVTRRRRVDFWTACGARPLPAPGYVLPDYTGSGLTEPMLLMAGPSAVAAQALASDQTSQLRQLVSAIYSDRYHLPHDHPFVVQALASIRLGTPAV